MQVTVELVGVGFFLSLYVQANVSHTNLVNVKITNSVRNKKKSTKQE